MAVELTDYDKYNTLAQEVVGEKPKPIPFKINKKAAIVPNEYEALRQTGVETSVIGRDQSSVNTSDDGPGGNVLGQNINETRAFNQSTTENMFSSLAKGTGLMISTVGSTFTTLPEGIVRASIAGFDDSQTKQQAFSKIYDNSFAEFWKSFNDVGEKAFPVYKPDSYEKDSLLKNMGTSQFWGETVLKNAGFTAGAIIGGGIIGKGVSKSFQLIGKIAGSAKAIENAAMVESLVQGGLSKSEALAKVAGNVSFASSKAQQLATGSIVSFGESSMEAKETYDKIGEDLIKKYQGEHGGALPEGEALNKIKQYQASGGNANLAFNMAVLTGSNTFQFGKLWQRGFAQEVEKVGEIATKDALHEAVKKTLSKKVAGVVGDYGVNTIAEATEEGLQTASNSGLTDYYSRKYDNDGVATVNAGIMSVLTGMQETFGTKGGLESMLAGAITGFGSHAITTGISKWASPKTPSDYEQALAVVNILNPASIRFKPHYDSMIRQHIAVQNKQKNAASSNPRRKIHEDENANEFRAFVQPYIETGRFDLLEDMLNQEYAKDEDRFKLDNGETASKKSGKDFVSKLMKDAKKLKNSWNDINDFMPKAPAQIREELWSIAADIENRQERLNSLNTKLHSQTGVNFNINKTGKQYLDELVEVEKTQGINDVSGNLIDYSMGQDIVDLHIEKSELNDKYKTLQSLPGQIAAMIANKKKEEEINNIVPTSLTPAVDPVVVPPVVDPTLDPLAPVVPVVDPPVVKTEDELVKEKYDSDLRQLGIDLKAGDRTQIRVGIQNTFDTSTDVVEKRVAGKLLEALDRGDVATAKAKVEKEYNDFTKAVDDTITGDKKNGIPTQETIDALKSVHKTLQPNQNRERQYILDRLKELETPVKSGTNPSQDVIDIYNGAVDAFNDIVKKQGKDTALQILQGHLEASTDNPDAAAALKLMIAEVEAGRLLVELKAEIQPPVKPEFVPNPGVVKFLETYFTLNPDGTFNVPKLLEIMKNYGTDSQQELLAKLLEIIGDVTMGFMDEEMSAKHQTGAAYTTQNGKPIILFNLSYLEQSPDVNAIKNYLPKVINHEILHHLTVGKLDEKGEFYKSIKEQLNLAKKTAKQQGLTGVDIDYGLQNVYEYVAEAFSNPEFQKFLDSIESQTPGVSLWEKFIELLVRGLSLNVSSSLLGDTIALVSSEFGIAPKIAPTVYVEPPSITDDESVQESTESERMAGGLLRTSGQHDQAIKEGVHSMLRFQNFVNHPDANFNGLKFMVINHTNPLYLKLQNKIQSAWEARLVKEGKPPTQGVMLVVVNENGEFAIADASGAITGYVKPENLSYKVDAEDQGVLITIAVKTSGRKLSGHDAVSYVHFARLKGIETDNAEKDALNEATELGEAWAKHVDELNIAREGMLNGTIKELTIQSNATGVFQNTKAFNEVGSVLGDIASLDIRIPTVEDADNPGFVSVSDGLTIPQNLRVGKAYVIKNGKLYPLQARKLNDTEISNITKMFNLIRKFPTRKAYFLGKIKELVHLTSSDIDAILSGKTNATNPTKMVQGKYRQVDANSLNENKKGKYGVASITADGVQDGVEQTYREFVLGGKEKALGINMNPHPTAAPATNAKPGDKNYPNFLNGYLQYKVKPVEGKPAVIDSTSNVASITALSTNTKPLSDAEQLAENRRKREELRKKKGNTGKIVPSPPINRRAPTLFSPPINTFQRVIPGQTHQQTKTIIDSVNGHFFNRLFEHGHTPDELLSTKGAKLIAGIYGLVYDDLYEDYLTEEENFLTKLHTPETWKAIKQHYQLMLNMDEKNEPQSLHTDVVAVHRTFLKGLGITIGTVTKDEANKDSNDIDTKDDTDDTKLTGEETGRSKADYTNSNEESSINSAPNSIKLLVMSLPQVNADGQKMYNEIGGPKLNDYIQTMKLLYANLNGISQFHVMYNKLVTLSDRFPVFKELVERLGDPGSNKELTQFLLETDFRQAFAKFESKGTITLINPETGAIYQVDANANKLKDRIKENWISNLRILAGKPDTYIKIGNDGVVFIDPSFVTDVRARKFSGNYKALLSSIGIDFTDLDQAQVQALPNIQDDVNGIFKSLAAEVEAGKVLNTLWDKKADVAGRLDSLLNHEVPLSRETVELSYISAENKRIYAVSLNNFYSLSVSALNNAKSLEQLYRDYPHFNNPYSAGSYWISRLFDEKGQKIPGTSIQMNTVSGLKIEGDNESGTSATKLEPADKIAQEINDLLGNGFASLIRAADKSTEHAFGLVTTGEKLAVPLKLVQDKGLDNEAVKEIFMGYFKAELGRIRSFLGLKDAEGNWVRKPIGSKIQIYQGQASNFSLFADILSPATLEELEAYKTTDKELSADLEAKIAKETLEYLKQYAADVQQYMLDRQIGVLYGKGYTGFDPAFTGMTQKGLAAAIQTFSVNHLINMIEQSKLLVGDSAFYKDKFKRVAAGTGTKKFAANDAHTNNWLKNFYNNIFGRVDKKEPDGKVNVVVFADNKVFQSNIEEYMIAVEAIFGIDKARKILEAYAKWDAEEKKWLPNMEEGDAQGWITLDEYREFMIRTGGAYWDERHEAQYRYEIALEKGEAEGMVNPEFYFMPIKAQYFGPQVMDSIYAPTFHKYSLAPIYHSLVKGRNMEDLLTTMREKKVGYAVFGSGVKLGAPLNSDNKLQPFYNEEGVESFGDDTPIQQIHYEFLGVQLDIAAKQKEKVIFGSQFRKLLFSNLFGDNTKNWVKNLSAEYNKIIDDLVQLEMTKLTKKLGLSYNEKGELSFTANKGDFRKLVETLRESLEDKDTADNILDSLQVDAKGQLLFPIDSMVNRDKIESMLFSIVNSKVIKQKMVGSSLPQLASTGFEPKGKRVIGESNYLKFYRKGKDGKTLSMEVEVPMMKTFEPLLQMFNGDLDKLNAAIDAGKIDKKMLTMIGYRIPTQGLNSIDHMTIRRFLPSTAGETIILPTGVVAKSGGDYDIDKLNVFRPQMYFDEKSGKAVLYDTKKVDKEGKPKKEGMQNRIVEIASEILSHEDNYVDLITPNTTDTLVELVGDVREARGESRSVVKASATKEFRFDTIMEQFTYFLGGKAGVGIGAVHNTHHILSQMAKVMLNVKLPFKSNVKIIPVDISKAKGTAIQMQPDNVAKILAGTKTTTTRSLEQAKLIKLKPGERGITTLGGKQFFIDYRGPQTIQEAGGKDEMLVSEGVESEEEFTFGQTKAWVNGKGELHVYDITPVGEGIKRLDLSQQYTQGGQKISDLISQFINAYVDVAKDPFYKDLNAGTDTAAVWFYLMRAGVDVKTIGYFMTQPIILDYVNAKKLNKSLVITGAGLDKYDKLLSKTARERAEADVELYSGEGPFIDENTRQRLTKTEVAEKLAKAQIKVNGSIYNDALTKYGSKEKVGAGDFNQDGINDKLKGWLTEGTSTNKSREFRVAQTQMLAIFMDLETQARGLGELMADTNNDTNKLQNYGSIEQRDDIAKKVAANTALIPAGTSARIKKATIVGSFDLTDKIGRMFKELTLYTKNPIIKAGLRKLIAGIDKKADFAKEYNKIQNDFIGYVTQKFGKTADGKPLYTKMSLLANANSTVNPAVTTKKNVFNVTPLQTVDKKAVIKASIATQYIGFAEGIANSSTEHYRQQAGKYANTGNYSAEDTIFVSVGGNRGSEKTRVEQQSRTIREAIKAIEAGATLITDNKFYVASNAYNTGEQRLAANLKSKGYSYAETIVDGQMLGVWTKTAQAGTTPSLAKQLMQMRREGLLTDNPFVNELLAQINGDTRAADTIKMYSRRISAFESNVYTEAFRELINSTDKRISEFGKNLAYLTILQSGLHNSPITFTSLIPFEFYGNIVKDAISIAENAVDMDDFTAKYYFKKGSPDYRIQNFGITDNVPEDSAERKAEDKLLPRQTDSNVAIGNEEALNEKQQLKPFTIQAGERVDVDTGEVFYVDASGKRIETKPVSAREVTPENITELKPNEVFVFGSNTEGKHGKGAAKQAMEFGARYGEAKGTWGQTYAIVTKDLTKGERSVSLESIRKQIVELNRIANLNRTNKYLVTKIGSSLAGFTINEIKEQFAAVKNLADNIILPQEYEFRLPVGEKSGFADDKTNYAGMFDNSVTASKEDTYRYFGAEYTVALDDKGKAVKVLTFKGNVFKGKGDKQLDAYNTNKDVDPQNGEYFRNKPVASTLKNVELKVGHEPGIVVIDDLLNYVIPKATVKSINGNFVTFVFNNGYVDDKRIINVDNINIQSDGTDAKGEHYGRYKIFPTKKEAKDFVSYIEEVNAQKGKQKKIDAAKKNAPLVLDKYELFPDVFANDGQKLAIDKIDDFLKDSVSTQFLLKGRGGTGKTTIIKKALKSAKGKLLGATVADKARLVLSDAFPSLKTSTVASLIGSIVEEIEGEPTFRLKNANELQDYYVSLEGEGAKRDPIDSIGEGGVLIIDEASMIDSETYYHLMLRAEHNGVKVIFMGDNVQIQPIGESNSPVFDLLNTSNHAVLTERMRQGAESPILPITDLLAENVEAKERGDKSSKDPLAGNRITNFDENTNEGVIFTESATVFLDSFAKDYIEHPDKSIIAIAWTNDTVSALNLNIRKRLYDNPAPYEVGEMVRLNSLWSKKISADKTEILGANGFEGKVKAVRLHSKTLGFQVYALDVEYTGINEKTGKEELKIKELTTVGVKDKKAFNTALKAYYRETIQSKEWKAFFYVKNLVANVNYNYAITANKVQGSTYDIAYVHERNISSNFDKLDAQKKLYTATSRPRTKLVMFNDEIAVDESPTPVYQAPKIGANRKQIREINNLDNQSIEEGLVDKTCKL